MDQRSIKSIFGENFSQIFHSILHYCPSQASDDLENIAPTYASRIFMESALYLRQQSSGANVDPTSVLSSRRWSDLGPTFADWEEFIHNIVNMKSRTWQWMFITLH